jgi:hypothetical protein
MLAQASAWARARWAHASVGMQILCRLCVFFSPGAICHVPFLSKRVPARLPRQPKCCSRSGQPVPDRAPRWWFVRYVAICLRLRGYLYFPATLHCNGHNYFWPFNMLKSKSIICSAGCCWVDELALTLRQQAGIFPTHRCPSSFGMYPQNSSYLAFTGM